MTDRGPIRVGVIGAGNIATLAHIPGLQRARGAQVVAICDPDVGRAEAAAARFGIEDAYDDASRMLEAARLDAVTIAAPPVEHAQVTLEAIRMGLHVLCEKPLAVTLSDAERMVSEADRMGVILAMNMHFRVLRECVALKTAIETGRLGRLRYVHIRYLRNDFFPPSGSWVTDPHVSGGGALADMGSHLIDLALWLLGADHATEVDAHLQSTRADDTRAPQSSGRRAEDFASVRLRIGADVTAVVECSWGFFGGDESRIQLIGERGGAEVSAGGGRSGALRFYSLSETNRVVTTPDDTHAEATKLASWAYATRGSSSRGPKTGPDPRSRLWYPTVASFVTAARGGAPPIATGHDGLAVLRVLDAAYASRPS